MDIDKLNKEFNELIKKFDEKTITEWLEQKRLEEKEEKRNKLSKKFYCWEYDGKRCEVQCIGCDYREMANNLKPSNSRELK